MSNEEYERFLSWSGNLALTNDLNAKPGRIQISLWDRQVYWVTMKNWTPPTTIGEPPHVQYAVVPGTLVWVRIAGLLIRYLARGTEARYWVSRILVENRQSGSMIAIEILRQLSGSAASFGYGTEGSPLGLGEGLLTPPLRLLRRYRSAAVLTATKLRSRKSDRQPGAPRLLACV
jgi:hypothetical protein